MQKPEFKDIWPAIVLGVAASWVIFGLLISAMDRSFYVDESFSDIHSTMFTLFPMMAATTIGGAVEGLLCESKWLPALVLALSMTVGLYHPWSKLAPSLRHDPYWGELIVLFISANFGQAITRIQRI